MANIQASIMGWSTTEASNQPDSTDATTLVGDLRAIQAGIRYYFSQDTIASAATTDLGSKEAGYLSISGTTTITAFGTVSAGIRKYIKFDGALTLTHNGTSLILPTAANITTVAGDVALMESLGSGNWRCLYYQRANGTALVGVQDGEVTNAKLANGYINDLTTVTAVSADYVAIADASDSGNKKKALVSDIVTLATPTYATTSQVTGTNTTGTITSGTASLTVTSGTGISNGDYVVGKGITPGTTVSSGAGGTSLTLSANANATLSSDPVTFYKPNVVLSPALVGGMLCRAWVNFNGTGTVAIRAAYNVTSITDNGVGNYTVNFTNAMPDANYVALALSGESTNTAGGSTVGANLSTTSCQFWTNNASTAAAADRSIVCVSFFR